MVIDPVGKALIKRNNKRNIQAGKHAVNGLGKLGNKTKIGIVVIQQKFCAFEVVYNHDERRFLIFGNIPDQGQRRLFRMLRKLTFFLLLDSGFEGKIQHSLPSRLSGRFDRRGIFNTVLNPLQFLIDLQLQFGQNLHAACFDFTKNCCQNFAVKQVFTGTAHLNDNNRVFFTSSPLFQLVDHRTLSRTLSAEHSGQRIAQGILQTPQLGSAVNKQLQSGTAQHPVIKRMLLKSPKLQYGCNDGFCSHYFPPGYLPHDRPSSRKHKVRLARRDSSAAATLQVFQSLDTK